MSASGGYGDAKICAGIVGHTDLRLGGRAREVLEAHIRAGGGRVDVAGLSEGARDQLFLALRLALLERRSGEPLPFIGDDILASFDDERTRATLALLADYGRRRQAILFTHHRHVADLARAAGADVIDL